MESRVGSFEAKTHLAALLERVSRGERFTITRHGRPVARLVPIAPESAPDIGRTVAEMLAYRDERGRTLDGVTFRALVEEGRRF